MSGIIDFVIDHPEVVNESGIQDFISSIAELAVSSRTGMEGVGAMGSAALGLGSVSRMLREPGRKIDDAIKAMVKATGKIDEWERRLTPYAKR
jgi:hypothetical protein